MNARIATGVALLLAATLATPGAVAKAAPKPPCNLLTDLAQDEAWGADDTVDVLSADLASDGTRITAVVRVAGNPAQQVDALAPLGRSYFVSFLGAGAKDFVYFEFGKSYGFSGAEYGHWDPKASALVPDGLAAWEVSKHTLTMSVPLTAFAGHGRFTPRSTLTGLTVTTGRIVGYYLGAELRAYYPLETDHAVTATPYVAGTPTCVRVL